MRDVKKEQHRVMHDLYELAFLGGRRRAGMALTLFEHDREFGLRTVMVGDTGRARRRFRRLSVMFPAEVKLDATLGRGTIFNMSASGAFLATTASASPGDRIMLKINRGKHIQYSFACKVLRADSERGVCYLAVSFEGIPLMVRSGGATDLHGEYLQYQRAV